MSSVTPSDLTRTDILAVSDRVQRGNDCEHKSAKDCALHPPRTLATDDRFHFGRLWRRSILLAHENERIRT